MTKDPQSDKAASINPKSKGRELAFLFLYQSDQEKVFHWSQARFDNFIDHLKAEPRVARWVEGILQGLFKDMDRIDQHIEGKAKNWSLSRIAATDLAVLRLATYELLELDTPPKVVLNEAIELAKRYGSENSGSFVNGILDRLVADRQA